MQVPSDIFWIILAVSGALLSVGAWIQRGKALATFNWPSAIATVTRVSEVDHFVSNDDSKTWYRTFEYQHEVDGRTYMNTYVLTGFDENRTRRAGLKKPVGAQFEILYNPEKPRNVLINGPQVPGYALAWSVIGACAVGIGTLLWLVDVHPAVPLALAGVGTTTAVAAHIKSTYPFERPGEPFHP